MYQHVELLNFTNHGMGITTVKSLCKNAAKHKQKYVAVCDFNSTSSWEELSFYSSFYDIEPIFGAVFKVRTPEECLIEFIDVYCFAKNQNGAFQIKRMYHSLDNGVLHFEVFKKFRQEIIVGFNLCLNERLMLTLQNVLDFFTLPDFVFVGKNMSLIRCWPHTFCTLQTYKIKLAATQHEFDYVLQENFPKELHAYLACLPLKNDETMIEEFAFLVDLKCGAVVRNVRELFESSDK